MNFESFIAKRYLVSKHKINFITIISFISIAGITVGVAALIVVLSVFNGFGSLVTSYLMNLDPHIRIAAISSEGEKDVLKLEEILINQKEIESYSPFIEGKVLAHNKGVTQVLNLDSSCARRWSPGQRTSSTRASHREDSCHTSRARPRGCTRLAARAVARC